MIATKSEDHYYCCGKDSMISVLVPGNKIRDKQSLLPSKETEKIYLGLCTDCRFLGSCVWQHNNKLTCEHFK